jgi:hypothetical protein
MASQRAPGLAGSPPGTWRNVPVWIKLEDIHSLAPMASDGPHAGHTSLTIGQDRRYTLIVWGTPAAWAEIWASNTGRSITSVE